MFKKQPSIKIISLTNQAVIADQCFVANSFFYRLMGLMGRRVFVAGQGMLFPDCNNIHMWFMRISLDVVFVRKEKTGDGSVRFQVSSLRENIRPWRAFPIFDFSASETFEFPSGTIRRCAIGVGDHLCIS